MHVRGTPGVQMIPPWIRSRLDGDEPVKACVIGQGAARTREVRVERRVMVVDRIQVAPRRVGLPHLDQGVAHRLLAAIEHATSDDDPLAQWLTAMLAREV